MGSKCDPYRSTAERGDGGGRTRSAPRSTPLSTSVGGMRDGGTSPLQRCLVDMLGRQEAALNVIESLGRRTSYLSGVLGYMGFPLETCRGADNRGHGHVNKSWLRIPRALDKLYLERGPWIWVCPSTHTGGQTTGRRRRMNKQILELPRVAWRRNCFLGGMPE